MTKNTNASASANGWNFQVNSAILLFLKNMKDVKSIRVEGKKEDIELRLYSSKKIYAQAKSLANPDKDSGAFQKFKDGLDTLRIAANDSDYEELVYVTNIINPLNTKDYNLFFSGEQSYYSTTELSENHINKINNIILSSNGKVSLDLSKLSIYYFSFFGRDDQTKYKVIYSEVREFLNKINVPNISANFLSNHWLGSLFKNASDVGLTLEVTKEDMIWPIIVMKCDINDQDRFFDEFYTSEIEEIVHQYKHIINYQSEKITLVNSILASFTMFQKESQLPRKQHVQSFIEENLTNFEELICDGITIYDEEIKRSLTKLIIIKIIDQKYLVDKIRKEVNLYDY